MSTNPSNLYAEKLLSEHPLAVWSLDDSADYVSLISESTRDITAWTKTNVATTTNITDSTAPFPSSYVTQVVGNATVTLNNTGITYLTSTNTFSASAGFTLTFYLQSTSDTYIEAGFGDGLTRSISTVTWNSGNPKYTTTTNHGYSIGDFITVTGTSAGGENAYDLFGYISATNFSANTFTFGLTGLSNFGTATGGVATRGLVKYAYVNFSSYPQNTWVPVSFRFTDTISNQKILLRLEYNDSSPTYKINGLTIGKNSEKFSGESLGKSLITLPTTISTTQTTGLESKNFGTQQYSAYYIGSGNNLYANNSGMGMSYGSNSCMITYPNASSGQPSFIFPGFGFLNEIGRYKELTLEVLLRMNVNSSTPQRIIGPLASTDGIYISNEFISLKIGDNVKSYYLSEMFKPTLLHFQIGPNYANLLIDGDTAISMNFATSDLSLPAKLDGSLNNQDWLGIYCYATTVPSLEVDEIAIYPYKVAEDLAKRRFIYAQGVQLPENSNTAYNGKTVSFDFSYANYINNYNYPRVDAKWAQATNNDNFDVKDKLTLSPQSYDTPTLSTSLYSSVELLKDIYATNVASGETNSFFNLLPTTVVSGSGRDWSTNTGFINLNSYNPNQNLSSCMYGVFKSLTSVASDQILLKIKNRMNNDYLQVSLNGTTVSYTFKYQNDSLVTLGTKTITTNTIFAVGINIATLKTLNSNISDFFGNTNNLDFYISGDKTLLNTFAGNIYKVGLCSKRNSSDISSLFGTDGILTSSSTYSALLSKTATYTVIAKNIFSQIIPDIAVNSYWENYVPLSKLMKNAYNSDGTQSNQLDFIQFNFDYPAPIRDTTSGTYSTSSSIVKTYVSFQTIESGANAPSSNFTSNMSPQTTDVIDATTFSSTTKYEIVDNMVIYPPTDTDLSTLALVLHVEANIDGINTKPVNIRYLQLAARTLDATKPNLIGTKYNIDIYPYIYNASTSKYDYKSYNPYLIYKGTTPYLYLTENSGVKLAGTYPSYSYGSSKGLQFSIDNGASGARVVSYQMSIFANVKEFSTLSSKIFNAGGINFYLTAADSTKTKGIISSDYTAYDGLAPTYYINGKKVANPVIGLNEWNMLGISLGKPISATSNNFSINSTDIVFNNISYYYANSLEIDQKSSTLSWSDFTTNSWAIPIPTQTPTFSANIITLSTTGAHNLTVGEVFSNNGLVPTTYNNTGYVTTVYAIPSSTSFSYVNPSLFAGGAITTAGTVLGTWQYASIPNYYSIYSNNLKNIYNIYLGTNKNVIDTYSDSKKILFSNYEYPAYMDAQINTITLDIL